MKKLLITAFLFISASSAFANTAEHISKVDKMAVGGHSYNQETQKTIDFNQFKISQQDSNNR